MPGVYKYPSFLFLFLLFGLKSEAQQIHAVCDSVFAAVRQESPEKLQDVCPGYSDLKAVYDSTDLEMMNYQIGLRQKELEYLTRKDMKALVKYAKSEKIRLSDLEKKELKIDSQKTEEGQSYAHIRIDCEARSKPYILHFVLISLNGNWFYGESLRIEKVEVVKEETPNYEEIDRELERKRQEREKEKQRVIEAEKERLEDSVAQRVKEEKIKQKEEETARRQKEKEEKEKLKQEELARKQKEKEERERLRLEKEKQKKAEQEAKEKEREKKAEEKKQLAKEKERFKKEEKERKEAEKKEKERLKKEEKKRREAEKKEKERLKKEEEKRKEEEKKSML